MRLLSPLLIWILFLILLALPGIMVFWLFPEETPSMRLTLLLYQLSAFLLYALFLIFLAARAFPSTEDRYSFYLDRRKIGLWPSLATFCATWMSAASITGFTFWLSSGGYAAFTGSVYGWLLGLLFLPFVVRKLRTLRVLSLPEWLSKTYGDERLRKVAALALVMAYTLYIVIQFRAFGTIVAHLLFHPDHPGFGGGLSFRALHHLRGPPIGGAERRFEPCHHSRRRFRRSFLGAGLRGFSSGDTPGAFTLFPRSCSLPFPENLPSIFLPCSSPGPSGWPRTPSTPYG